MIAFAKETLNDARNCTSAEMLVSDALASDGAEIFSEKEVRKICTLAMSVKDAKSFSDICRTLGADEDWVRSMFGIPSEVVELPDYIVTILACIVIVSIIEDERTRTCQMCGRMFLSETEKMVCESCEKLIFSCNE